MGRRRWRFSVLTLALLLAGCAAQLGASRSSERPSQTESASPTPRTNASSDLLYLRSIGDHSRGSIVVIDARSQATLRTMPGGPVSADRSTLYWTEPVNGATQTVIHVAELSSGRELRTFTIEGDFSGAAFTGSVHELTGRAIARRHLVLQNRPFRNELGWVTRIAVVDTLSGAITGKAEIVSPSTFSVLALSDDARSLFVDQVGDHPAKTRVWDMPSGQLADVTGSGISSNGLRTPGVFSPDGRWMFRVDAGDMLGTGGIGPFVVALDLHGRRAITIPLQLPQRSSDFDRNMLWSLALDGNGSRLFAVNPALGVVNEIDARELVVRRTAPITVSRPDGDAIARLGHLFLPVAEAKRYMFGGAVLSPDGRTLFAAGNAGITVVDTATLASHRVISVGGYQFDLLALSSDGARLYAVDNMSRTMFIWDARDGARLGDVKLGSFVPGIVRIDAPR